MTTTLSTAPAKTSSGLRNRADVLARLAVTLAGVALLVVCWLTIALWRQVDLLRDPVSDYAFFAAGRGWFAVAIALVLLAGFALVMAMGAAGLARATVTNVLFGLWAGGLLLVAVFPGNRSADDPTLHGEIHRLGGAVFLTCLPLACWTLAKTLGASPLWADSARLIRRLSVVGLVTAAAFGLAQVVPALPQGLLERFALGAELALLVAVASSVRRAA